MAQNTSETAENGLKGDKTAETDANSVEAEAKRVLTIDIYTRCDGCGGPFQPLQLQYLERWNGQLVAVHQTDRCRTPPPPQPPPEPTADELADDAP